MALPSTIQTLESVNMICGDATTPGVEGTTNQPGVTTHLQIAELKLPGIEENYADHRAGGAPFAIEVPTHYNRLESTFNLIGFQPAVMRLVAASQRAIMSFTAYGLIRDQRTGLEMQAVAYMNGRLGRVNPQNFRKGDQFHHEYSIRAIMTYHLRVQTDPTTGQLEEVYFWDFFSNDWFVGEGPEANMMARHNQLLAIAGV